ncbi:MarR family winged helix-turn-helix transcriptional regulator [Streptomyces sp. NPDC055886]
MQNDVRALAGQVSAFRNVATESVADLPGGARAYLVPRDRRGRQVLITDAGRTRLTEVRHSLAAAEACLLDDDASRLRTLLSRVARTAQRDSTAPDKAAC